MCRLHLLRSSARRLLFLIGLIFQPELAREQIRAAFNSAVLGAGDNASPRLLSLSPPCYRRLSPTLPIQSFNSTKPALLYLTSQRLENQRDGPSPGTSTPHLLAKYRFEQKPLAGSKVHTYIGTYLVASVSTSSEPRPLCSNRDQPRKDRYRLGTATDYVCMYSTYMTICMYAL